MRMRRLGWAGLEIEHAGQSLIIDAVQNNSPMFSEEVFPLPSRLRETAAALVTHIHFDHADAATIGAALTEGAPVFLPETVEDSEDATQWRAGVDKHFPARSIRTEALHVWDERQVGPFRVIAVPAIDGLGEQQNNWIVEVGGTRLFHGGDTMFHGFWWSMARRVGPVDLAFVPINGAVVDVPHLQPASPFIACMDPEQAVVAAHILGARARSCRSTTARCTSRRSTARRRAPSNASSRRRRRWA